MTILFTIVLLFLSALFSGLLLGMMSLSLADLERKAQTGNLDAQKVLPLRKEGNRLLATLIIANVSVNAVLATTLSSLVPALFAVILTTLLVAVFGSLLPQALFSRYAIKLGAFFSPFVRWLVNLLGPINKPIGAWLDRIIGAVKPEPVSKAELFKIIDEYKDTDKKDLKGTQLSMVKHALGSTSATVKDVMTPRTVVIALQQDMVLNALHQKELKESGHSRFPVYSESLDTVTGILYIHELVGISSKKTAGQLADKEVHFTQEDMPIADLFDKFISSHHHLFIVNNEFKEMVGIVSLEDVVEHILGRDIIDEFDKNPNLRAEARKEGEERNREAEQESKHAQTRRVHHEIEEIKDKQKHSKN